MNVRQQDDWVVIQAPAKLNLFLEILGKRSDGYHELETLMVPIDLYDTLCVQDVAGDRLELECFDARQRSGFADRVAVPSGPDNLVLRALLRIREEAGVRRGARIVLTKRIPLGAGLAGGSSNAAAALVAANLVWRLGWSRERLAELAAELGSDVPFFLGPGAAICRGRGERVARLKGLGVWHFVVAFPDVGLATAKVFGHCQVATSARAVQPLVDALRRHDVAMLGHWLHNQLQPAAEALEPAVGRLAREFARIEVWGRQMSGSGTSFFGICRSAAHARRAAALLSGRGVGSVFRARNCQ